MKADRIRQALKVGLRVAKAEEILSYKAEKELLQAAIKDCDDIFGPEGHDLKAPPEHVKGEGLEAIMESLREVTHTGYEWQRLDFNLVLSNTEEVPALAESLKANLHRMDMIVMNVLQRLYMYQERRRDGLSKDYDALYEHLMAGGKAFSKWTVFDFGASFEGGCLMLGDPLVKKEELIKTWQNLGMEFLLIFDHEQH